MNSAPPASTTPRPRPKHQTYPHAPVQSTEYSTRNPSTKPCGRGDFVICSAVPAANAPTPLNTPKPTMPQEVHPKRNPQQRIRQTLIRNSHTPWTQESARAARMTLHTSPGHSRYSPPMARCGSLSHLLSAFLLLFLLGRRVGSTGSIDSRPRSSLQRPRISATRSPSITPGSSTPVTTPPTLRPPSTTEPGSRSTSTGPSLPMVFPQPFASAGSASTFTCRPTLSPSSSAWSAQTAAIRSSSTAPSSEEPAA